MTAVHKAPEIAAAHAVRKWQGDLDDAITISQCVYSHSGFHTESLLKPTYNLN